MESGETESAPPAGRLLLVPRAILDHDEMNPIRLAVLIALIAEADDERSRFPDHPGYECAPTRERLCKLARVSPGTVIKALAWLRGVGAIAEVPDQLYVARRRFVLTHAPEAEAAARIKALGAKP